MGIQINGQTDIISATDGSLTISGATLPTAEVTNLNATGIVTATGFVGNVTGNINATGVSTIATLNVTQSNPTNLNVSGVTTTATLRATSIVGVTTAGITTAYIGAVNDGPLSGARNRIINGDMRIDQRNAGASISVSSGAGFAVDRFNLYASSGTYSFQRVSDAPTGFSYSSKITVSSAGSSGSSNALHFEQKIEGYNIDDLGVGTSNAKVVTLSFWVKSSVTGTYSLHFGNDTDRFYVTTYSISSANTWEYKTKTITLATSGTWNTTNGRGLEIVWSLLGGSTYQTSSTDQWISAEDFHATGSVQFGENAAATWQITGVQLEPGTVATPFERRSYGQELALCQRYLPAINGSDGNGYLDVGYIQSSNQMNTIYRFSVPTRTKPTGMTVSTPGNCAMTTQSAGGTWSSVLFNNSTITSAQFTVTMTTSSWASQINYMAFWSVNSGLILFTGCEL